MTFIVHASTPHELLKELQDRAAREHRFALNRAESLASKEKTTLREKNEAILRVRFWATEVDFLNYLTIEERKHP